MNFEELAENVGGMTLDGEHFREKDLERGDEKFAWRADILSYEEFWEIEMIYVLDDPEKEIFSELREEPTSYSHEHTDSIYPTVDRLDGETRVVANIPIKKSLDHEIAEFPSQYVDDLRDSFYREVISRG